MLDPYFEIYNKLNELNYMQTILRINGKEDSLEYHKISEYIEYLQDKYITPRTVNEIYANRVLTGKLSKSEFEKWVTETVGRPDLINGGLLL